MAATILIAEDEPFIVESLSFLLTRRGHQVHTAADGLAAVRRTLDLRPDLLILDVMMPGQNGFDVLRRLRDDPNFDAMPILALTAKGQEADRTRLYDLGADAFLAKPYANDEVVACVERLLEAPRASAKPAGGRRAQRASQ